MVLSDNVVSAYHLDGNGNDSAGSNNLTISGATSDTSNQKLGTGCYDLDGTNDYLQASSSVLGTGDKTIAFWFYPQALALKEVISNGYGLSGNPRGFDLFMNATGTLRANVGNTADGEFLNTGNTTNTLSINNWYCIMLIQDSNQLYLYVNNVLWGSDTSSTGTEEAPSYNFTVGMRPGGNDYNVNARYDEIVLWNRALSSAERSEFYNSGSGIAYPFSAGTSTNFQINIGDSWKTVEALKINIGDVWKDVDGAQVNIGDSWKTIF